MKSEQEENLKIYLDTPVMINGVRIGHTQDGLIYLIQHYEHMLTMNPVNRVTGPARSDKDTEYMRTMIANLKWHLELYKKEEAQK
jgi:hypothetical protein